MTRALRSTIRFSPFGPSYRTQCPGSPIRLLSHSLSTYHIYPSRDSFGAVALVLHNLTVSGQRMIQSHFPVSFSSTSTPSSSPSPSVSFFFLSLDRWCPDDVTGRHHFPGTLEYKPGVEDPGGEVPDVAGSGGDPFLTSEDVGGAGPGKCDGRLPLSSSFSSSSSEYFIYPYLSQSEYAVVDR